jgi:hypothetical protein
MNKIIFLGFAEFLFSSFAVGAGQPSVQPVLSSLPRSNDAKNQKKDSLSIIDWLAFGSGCNASKSKSSKEFVRIGQTGPNSFEIQLYTGGLKLKMGDRPAALTECAVRLSLQPAPATRISHISVRTALLASKDDSIHLRSHALMMAGDTLVGRNTWDLSPADFARQRFQNIFLSAGSTAETAMPRSACGKPQIIGLDFTFEGKRTLIENKGQSRADAEISVVVPEGIKSKHDVVFNLTSESCKD